jgi:hypothetical protein
MITEWISAYPCLARIDSMFFFCEMLILSLDHLILMLIILEGSPILVISHLECRSFFVCSIAFLDPANSSRLFTQTVMIATSLLYL